MYIYIYIIHVCVCLFKKYQPCFPRSFLRAAPGGSPKPLAAACRHGLPAPRGSGGARAAGVAGGAVAVRVAAAGAQLGHLRSPGQPGAMEGVRMRICM